MVEFPHARVGRHSRRRNIHLGRPRTRRRCISLPLMQPRLYDLRLGQEGTAISTVELRGYPDLARAWLPSSSSQLSKCVLLAHSWEDPAESGAPIPPSAGTATTYQFITPTVRILILPSSLSYGEDIGRSVRSTRYRLSAKFAIKGKMMYSHYTRDIVW